MPQLTIEQAFELAARHHRSGRLQDAEQLCRQILARQPEHLGAILGLGVIALDVGRYDIAVDLIRRAIALRPDFPEAHSSLASALKGLGRLDEAIAACRQAIILRPGFAEAHFNLGVILTESGHTEQAISAFRQAIALKPTFAEAHCNLGCIRKDTGNLDEAITAFRQAVALNPDYAEAHNNLGNALREKGQLDDSIAACRQAILLRPDYAEAHNNLGLARRAKGQIKQSVEAFRQAIALKPGFAEAYNDLGSALADLGQMNEAIAAYRQAIALKPNYPEAHSNLGKALNDAGQRDEAIRFYREAISLRPSFAEAHHNLGNALKDDGCIDAAIGEYRQAIALSPNLPDPADNLLYTLHFHPGYDAAAIAGEHRLWNHRHAQPLASQILPHRNDRSPTRRLRIGYLSPDFRHHPVGLALLPVLEQHNPAEVEIVCLSNVEVPDSVTKEFQSCAHVWRSLVGLSDEQATELIRREEIDILVDLSLHMLGNRLLVFVRKPAPVQVTWLGYPSTTGLTTIDYRLSDPYIDPPDADPPYVEKTLRLPHSYLCWRWSGAEAATSALPMLANGYITFGSLNNFSKVGPEVLTAWARILSAVPNSRLILRCSPGEAVRRVRAHFAGYGIVQDRLELIAWSPRAEYIEQIRRQDICLDPFPYPGHTTSCDALWMGVPVVTLAGATSVARGGVSLLSNLGLPELVATETDEYVRIATSLANDARRLNELRSTLRQRMKQSPLMDAPQFARDVEAACRQMWRIWCENCPAPAPGT